MMIPFTLDELFNEAMLEGLQETITRFEVIDSTGRIYVNNECKIKLLLQDNNKTLKVIING